MIVLEIHPRFIASVMLCLCSGAIRAENEPISFNRDIRPILSSACIKCHGPDEDERKGGTKESGGLRFDTEEGSRQALDEGFAIVPGHPEKSALLARVTTNDPDDIMPPPKSGKKLSATEVKLLEDWIRSGAKFTKHWSYKTPVRPEPPKSAPNPIDSFIQQRLEKEGLKQQPEADRATLIRRLGLDVTGLPPSPEEVEAFVNDQTPGAYDRLVDKLLASPAYGEHWGRQWLDLARYADSSGYADDPPRTIWAFRDYVIKSFNANKPFDQFTVEQIAGDMLPNPTEEQIIATAFHRNTMTNSEGGTNDEEFRNAAIVDRVNTTMAVWMGTSMACAQCHTHKYDPITQKEYFQMFAILNNTADADQPGDPPLHNFYSEEQKTQRAALEQDLAATEVKFISPGPELLAAATKWGQQFPIPLTWQALKPAGLKSQAGLEMTQEPDGAVLVSKTAARDTYTLEIPITSDQQLSALRLEALPQDTLPGKGPGHAGGNFVLTRLRAVIDPPQDKQAIKARFLRIELPGQNKILQLAEVQVFSGAANVAQHGVASQKSTYADAVASRANDGNTEGAYDKGSVAHTAVSEVDPWWEVDLKSEVELDRIVVWSRAELPERLAGFRVVALNDQRQPVWEKADNPAGLEVPISLNGGREIVFAAAAADFVQGDFDVDHVISDNPAADPKLKQKTRGSQKGWAVGGSTGSAHSLTLMTGAPVALPAGSRLRISLDQQSQYANHTLGHFRLSATADAGVEKILQVPANLAGAVAIPEAQRDAAQKSQITDYYVREIAAELAAERTMLADLRKQLDSLKPNTVPVYQELAADKRRKTHVNLRGNYLSLGEEVSEGVPATFHPLKEGEAMNRLGLARWLVDEKNPLTPRVMANRYWESLFGTGIVRTSEEFGMQGELPSHPELLDWLATELIRTKWDLKNFVRLMVTSASYRQSSKFAPGAADLDPENRLLARGPRFRLSAEMVRDQALAVSGLLSHKMFGPSVRPLRPSSGLSAAFGGGLDWQSSTGEDRLRRGIYTEWRRTSPYPSMTTFDAPNRETCTLRRGRSNTPLQALVTMNDPVYVEASQGLARRLTVASPDAMLRQAYQLVLSRLPSEKELQRLLKLYDETLAFYKADAPKATEMATNPIGPVPQGADVAELASWTTVCGVLLNLDETLMKR